VHKIIQKDLDHILFHTVSLWEELRGKRLFITGGTGFFGYWLLECFICANERFLLEAEAVVLTRNIDAFVKFAPHIASNPAVRFHHGDVRTFDFPHGEFSHIIHAAATSAAATFNNEDPLEKFATVVDGTRHTLDFAVHCNARKLLLTSSGAVYGGQPDDVTHIPEDYVGAPVTSTPQSTWGESKRAAELLCTLYAGQYGFEAKIARCFSFVGPYLPLDIHYAVGNFIRDALNGGPIVVNGDGTPCRSYLYTSDLMIWLWTILFRGDSCKPYNVGSEAALSIAELADRVAHAYHLPIDVRIMHKCNPNSNVQRYVPLTKRAQATLGLMERIGIDNALSRTLSFFASQNDITAPEEYHP
jgi:dTDP-glucose 4,6-dehydratase